jgi:HAMP domain-containing protein
VTLRARLTTVFVAVVVIPLLVGAVLLATSLPSAFGEQQGRAATAAARFGSSLVADACTRARTAAEVAGRSVLALPPGSTDRQVEALQELVQRDLADGLQVSDDDGLVAGAGRVPPDPVDCRTAEATSGAVTAVVALQQPGGDGAAVTTGTAVAAVLLDDAFARQLQENSGGDVALIAQGEVVAATAQPPAGLLRTALSSEDAPVHEGRWVAVYEPPGPGAPLGVLVVQQAPRGIAVVRTTGAVVLGAVLLAAGLALLLARATVRPLEELGEAAERVAGGDLSTTIDVRSRDEVGQLASAFNVMTDRPARLRRRARDQPRRAAGGPGPPRADAHQHPRPRPHPGRGARDGAGLHHRPVGSSAAPAGQPGAGAGRGQRACPRPSPGRRCACRPGPGSSARWSSTASSAGARWPTSTTRRSTRRRSGCWPSRCAAATRCSACWCSTTPAPTAAAATTTSPPCGPWPTRRRWRSRTCCATATSR